MSGLTIAISAGLAAAGAGTEAYANNQQLRAQDRVAAQGLVQQGILKQQANADVQKNIQQAQGNQKAVNTNQADLTAQYAAALQRAAPVQGTQGAMPGASKRYAADTTAAQQAALKYGTGLATTAAGVGAPQLTNEQTQQSLGDTATKLGGLSDQSAQQAALTNMQVQSIQANPWLLAAGAALQGASKGYGSYAGYNNAAAQPLGSGTAQVGGTAGTGVVAGNANRYTLTGL
jgi:hypothetical protein